MDNQEKRPGGEEFRADNRETDKMNKEFHYMLNRAARGLMGRREFLGRASAMGISAAMASTLLASAARAEGPV